MADASATSAGTGASLGTGCRRGRPVAAFGQSSSTVVAYTFCTLGMPTAQSRPRALRPRRKAALIPYRSGCAGRRTGSTGVRHHPAEAGAGGHDAVDLGKRDVCLRQRSAVLLGHARAGAALGVGGPAFRQEQPQPDRHRDLAPGQGERDQDLAVRPLAEAATVLAGDPDRVPALLGQGGVVDDQYRVGAADEGIGPLDQEPPQGRVVPSRAREEVLELVVAAQAEPGSHGLQALAIAGPDQPLQVDRRPPAPLLVPQHRQERPEPTVQLLAPVRFRHRHRPAATSRCDNEQLSSTAVLPR